MDKVEYPPEEKSGLDTQDHVEPNRRGSNRFRTVCRMARVEYGNDVGLWRVRNISDEGMMLRTDISVAVGERLQIALSETTLFDGTVLWTDKDCCDVAFDHKIDATAVLHSLADEQRSEGHRALRLPTDAKAILALDDGAQPIDLVNISQSGAGYVYDKMIEPGTKLRLLIPGCDIIRHAVVRWSDCTRGGLWFTKPVDLDSIVRILDQSRYSRV